MILGEQTLADFTRGRKMDLTARFQVAEILIYSYQAMVEHSHSKMLCSGLFPTNLLTR